MYNVMKKFILTEEQLVDNGFPRPDPEVFIHRYIVWQTDIDLNSGIRQLKINSCTYPLT